MNILPETLSQLPSKLAGSLSTSLLYFRRFPAPEPSRARSDEERDSHRLCVIRPLSHAVTPAKNSFVCPSCLIRRDRTISSFLAEDLASWDPSSISTDIVRYRFFRRTCTPSRRRSSNALCVSSAARTLFFPPPYDTFFHTYMYIRETRISLRAISLIFENISI